MNDKNATGQSGIPVFWTSGVDSTFRVLELLVRYGCRVQPIYVVDPARFSYQIELETMGRIRQAMADSFPDASALLNPTLFVNVEVIEVSKERRNQFAILQQHFDIPPQYEWLAGVGVKLGFETIELSIQKNEARRLNVFIASHIVSTNYRCGAIKNTMRDWSPQDDFEEGMKLFNGFAFPTVNHHTDDMVNISKEYEFFHLLRKAWICRMPIRGEPCGTCGVCRDAIRAGKSAFFPEAALRRNKYWRVLNPLHILRVNPKGVMEKAQQTIVGIWKR